MIASRILATLRGRFLSLYCFVLYLLSHQLAQSGECDFRVARDGSVCVIYPAAVAEFRSHDCRAKALSENAATLIAE
jgi:hypothetical protein